MKGWKYIGVFAAKYGIKAIVCVAKRVMAHSVSDAFDTLNKLSSENALND